MATTMETTFNILHVDAAEREGGYLGVINVLHGGGPVILLLGLELWVV